MGEKNGNGNAPIDVWLSRWAETSGEHAAAGWGALLAAWRSEAQDEMEDAGRSREQAIEFWQLAEKEGEETTKIGLAGSQLLLAETHRRLGRFEDALACCRRGLAGRPADPIRSLLEFEIELISAEDTDSHAVSEVLRRGL